MLLHCDTSAADRYTSQAQKSRVLSEAWFEFILGFASADPDFRCLRPPADSIPYSLFFCPCLLHLITCDARTMESC